MLKKTESNLRQQGSYKHLYTKIKPKDFEIGVCRKTNNKSKLDIYLLKRKDIYHLSIHKDYKTFLTIEFKEYKSIQKLINTTNKLLFNEINLEQYINKINNVKLKIVFYEQGTKSEK